jgi:uncharacterized protein (TIGR02757 family)
MAYRSSRTDVRYDPALHESLDRVRAKIIAADRLHSDPVQFAHRYVNPLDKELVALAASAMAFGNVASIVKKTEVLLEQIGPSPHRAADSLAKLQVTLAGFRHRVYVGDDLARLLAGARAVQRQHGSLGDRFAALLATCCDLREGLAAMCDDIRAAAGLPSLTLVEGERRGPKHVLADPRGGGANKRLMLFLRWMIRPPDGVDLGLWRVEPSVLVIPLDTHIHKVAMNLGFTNRSQVSWQTAVEVTDALRLYDAADPVKYDFSLCHLGMLQRCPSRRDPNRCDGCPLILHCRHWRGKKAAKLPLLSG